MTVIAKQLKKARQTAGLSDYSYFFMRSFKYAADLAIPSY